MWPEKKTMEATVGTKIEVASQIMSRIKVFEPVFLGFMLTQLPTFHLPAQCSSQFVLADVQYDVVAPHDIPPSQLQQPVIADACGCNDVDFGNVDVTGPWVIS